MPGRRFERLLLVVWWLVCLIGAEYASRAIAPMGRHRPRWHGFVADSLLGYRQRPNLRGRIYFYGTIAVRTNRFGLRDRDYGPRQPGVRRLLMLGDSQTFGLVSEDQPFSRQLERRLASGGGRWEVINAGLNGYGTEQELELFRQLLPVYRPDLVMLTVYANDVYDNRFAPRERWWVDAEGNLHTRTEFPAPAPKRRAGWAGLRDRIAGWSNLFTLASNAAGRIARREAPGLARRPEEPPPYYVEQLLARRWSADQQRGWSRTDSLLMEFGRTARESSVRLILVDGASRAAISWALWPAGSDTARYDLDRETALLDSAAHRAGIPCVHLLPALRRVRDPARLYIVTDDHWGPRGHQLVAELLEPVVRAALAGPPEARADTAASRR